MKNIKIILNILIVVVLGFLLVSWIYKSTEKSIPQTTTLPEVVADDWVYGNKDAKVTVVEYLDFECEACKAYYPITTKLKEEYKDDMRFVVRYFPLPAHKNSLTAAKAVESAGRQGKFWEMYSMLYEKQNEWGEQQTANQDQFEKYAREVGVNIEQWKKDVNSTEVAERVQRNYQEAMKMNLAGTPSFFLNGKKIDSPKGYESFKLLIEKAKNNE